MSDGRTNVLFVVSDEERRNEWMEGHVDLPHHERLRRDGMSFDRYFTHSSPCSPSRASLYTGRYLPGHRVVDNVSFLAHTALDPGLGTTPWFLTVALVNPHEMVNLAGDPERRRELRGLFE